jgi:hypothetical protein
MTLIAEEPTAVIPDRIVGRGTPLLPDEPLTVAELFIKGRREPQAFRRPKSQTEQRVDRDLIGRDA